MPVRPLEPDDRKPVEIHPDPDGYRVVWSDGTTTIEKQAPPSPTPSTPSRPRWELT